MTTEDRPEWKQKAEEYLERTLKSPFGYPAQEALIYMISRGKNCDQIIQQVRDKWRTDSEACPFADKYRFWASYNPYVIFNDSTMLRTAEWCKIGGYEQHWKHICKTTEFYHEKYSELDHFPYFPYFRSNYFITKMRKQLSLSLHGYQEHLTKILGWNQIYYQNIEGDEWAKSHYFVNTLLSAALIFGSCQLQGWDLIDPDAISDVTTYLLKSQLTNGSWWFDESGVSLNGVYQASIAIHALCLAKPEGYEHVVKMAKEWILTQQHPNGCWEDSVIVPCNIFLTVLVLDAIELAEGGKQVTFHTDKNTHQFANKGPECVTPNHDHSIVINIHGGTPKTQKYHKKQVVTTSAQPDEPVREKVEWKGLHLARFIIDKENCISFIYQDNDPIPLHFNQAHHPKKLLPHFLGNKDLKGKDITTVLNTHDSISHRIKEINGLIHKEIQKGGFCEIPKYFEFIERIERGCYRCVIPVMTIDEFDKEYLTSNEKYEYNPLENSNPDKA